MTFKKIVHAYLQKEPLFRERKNKDRGIVNLLMKRYGGLNRAIESGLISKTELTAIVQDYATMDRSWRQTLEQNESLRGKDYADKPRLEEKKLQELGYRPRPQAGHPTLV